MTIMQQIVTIKVTYDDGVQDACSPGAQENCCGAGSCSNVRKNISGTILDVMECCGGHRKLEILQETEPREVISEESF